MPLPSPATSARLSSVSCASAASCQALVGADGYGQAAEYWNGSSWTAENLPGQQEETGGNSVSCVSAGCMAVGFTANSGGGAAWAVWWNGNTWASSYPVDGAGSAALNGVSCLSARYCMAVGSVTADSSTMPFAESWNGTKWAARTVPAPSPYGTRLSSVSCTSASFCVAVGGTGESGAAGMLVYTWNGSAWTQQTLPVPAGISDPALTGVSCTSPSSCTAVGGPWDDGDLLGTSAFAEHWNGTAWTATALPLPSRAHSVELSSVSCVKAACTAAGLYTRSSAGYYRYHPLAEFFSGRKWSVRATASPSTGQRFQSVSCVAARVCTAVGAKITYPKKGLRVFEPLAEQERA